MGLTTVHRLLQRAGLMTRQPDEISALDRRRFAAAAGQLWMSDVMDVPTVAVPGRGRRTTYLIAFLDDPEPFDNVALLPTGSRCVLAIATRHRSPAGGESRRGKRWRKRVLVRSGRSGPRIPVEEEVGVRVA